MEEFVQAAGEGDLDTMKLLMQKGDGVDIQEALREATEEGVLHVVQYLIEICGAKVNSTYSDGYTVLMWASLSDDIELVQYLVESGARVDTQQKDRYTPLMWAAQYNRKELVRYLAGDCDADVNVKNNDGFTALMLAAFNKNTEVVRYLAEECGADVDAKSNDGKTAVKLAADRGYLDIQRILTPFLMPTFQSDAADVEPAIENANLLTEVVSSCSISPAEVELTRYSHNGSIGGDFLAKWLDADAVVKLFVPEASQLTFEEEVRLWQQLRHPNVIKMYGACSVDPPLKFFVCEYANNGSLLEQVEVDEENKSNVWKYLYEAALGLEYLHERGIVHGDLRCSNILIGTDGAAKLSSFGLGGSTKRSGSAAEIVVGSMRWQAPEVLEGKPLSFESDVYSLGMCILEAVSGKMPWANLTEYVARSAKSYWSPEDNADSADAPGNLSGDVREFVRLICCQNPSKRASFSSIIYELERLAVQTCSSHSESQASSAISIEDFGCGNMAELWLKVQTSMEKCNNDQYRYAFDDINRIYERVQDSTHHPTVLGRFEALLTDFYRTIKVSPDQARIMRLSSTRATTNSLYALHWRINSVMTSLGEEFDAAKERETKWQQQRSDQVVYGVSDTFLLLKDLKSAEERSVFLKTLRAEMKDPLGKYTSDQLDVMAKTYEDISTQLESEDVTPEWFIPWYELIIDEWKCLGAGGFGSVYLAKWLDSDVVVKQVTVAGLHDRNETLSYDDSYLSFSVSMDPTASQVELDGAKRAEALVMFRREVDIWFGFSHPHVVRLFGACHVGRPFFVCEYATNGTLVSYLRKHPDQVWTKLFEAALGVQYLHARNVVHGDLKGNNIVVGSDLKAKVTDFGLSSVASSETSSPLVSAASHWVAPECFDSKTRPSFASDVYSLGMCIVEALRVVGAVNAGNTTQTCLPWGNQGNFVVKAHAAKGRLPSRPTECDDKQWELVKRMCVLDSKKRIKISTVVDNLAKVANLHTSNQDDTKPTTDSVNWNSVLEVIANSRRGLDQLRDAPGQQDEVLSIYSSLWDRLEQVYKQIDDSLDAECRASFCALVLNASTCTANLQDSKANLVSLAETTMRCYALGRAVDKLCDAYFIVR